MINSLGHSLRSSKLTDENWLQVCREMNKIWTARCVVFREVTAKHHTLFNLVDLKTVAYVGGRGRRVQQHNHKIRKINLTSM